MPYVGSRAKKEEKTAMRKTEDWLGCWRKYGEKRLAC
jgi:hypothetical protein